MKSSPRPDSMYLAYSAMDLDTGAITATEIYHADQSDSATLEPHLSVRCDGCSGLRDKRVTQPTRSRDYFTGRLRVFSDALLVTACAVAICAILSPTGDFGTSAALSFTRQLLAKQVIDRERHFSRQSPDLWLFGNLKRSGNQRTSASPRGTLIVRPLW